MALGRIAPIDQKLLQRLYNRVERRQLKLKTKHPAGYYQSLKGL